jgi:hypothetical protein
VIEPSCAVVSRTTSVSYVASKSTVMGTGGMGFEAWELGEGDSTETQVYKADESIYRRLLAGR